MPRHWTYSDPNQGDLERCVEAWQEHCGKNAALTLTKTPSKRICRAFYTPDGQRGIELHTGNGLLARFLVTPERVTLLEREPEQVEE